RGRGRVRVAPRGHHDDRYATAARPHVRGQPLTVEARHRQIGDDEPHAVELGERVAAVARVHDLDVGQIAQHRLDERADHRGVVDDEDARHESATTRTWLRPAAFASYSALSARWIKLSRSSSACSCATPIETVIGISAGGLSGISGN